MIWPPQNTGKFSISGCLPCCAVVDGLYGDGSEDAVFRVLTPDVNWISICTTGTSGSQLSMAVKANGTLWYIGRTPLGPGTSIFVLTQFGTDSDWAAIYCTTFVGGSQLVAAGIKTDGTLWGISGYEYQLGISSSPTAQISAVTQIGVDTDWAYVSGSTRGLLAIKTDGTLYGCGLNQVGLGGGTTFPLTPIAGSNWVSVTNGDTFVLGLRTDGNIYLLKPSSVVSLIDSDGDWISVNGQRDDSYFLAIKSDGTLWYLLIDASTGTVDDKGQVGTDTDWITTCAGCLAIKDGGTLWGFSFPSIFLQNPGGYPDGWVSFYSDTWGIGVRVL